MISKDLPKASSKSSPGHLPFTVKWTNPTSDLLYVELSDYKLLTLGFPIPLKLTINDQLVADRLRSKLEKILNSK